MLPSVGDYFEGGLSQGLFGKVKLDINYFRRVVNNYADDDQIDNTSISFPIAFRKAIIYGAEGKLDLPEWRKFSGFLSYSYEVGNAWNPVTGGLFLGDDATAAETQLSGHFPDSQDQRNTVRGRVRYQVNRRFWLAGGIQYDTGLPFEFDGDPATVLAEYGQQVLDRINFDRGRIYPSFQVNASAGANLYSSERVNVQLQARRPKPQQCSGCNRFRWAVLRKCNRALAERVTSSHNDILIGCIVNHSQQQFSPRLEFSAKASVGVLTRFLSTTVKR